MKVSDAMRLADEMGIPDARHMYIERNIATWDGERPRCCAIGGAAVASGSFRMKVDSFGYLIPDSASSAMDLTRCDDRINFARPRLVDCPCGDGIRLKHRYQAAIHLYERHKWSRTQIADWLDSLDGAEVA